MTFVNESRCLISIIQTYSCIQMDTQVNAISLSVFQKYSLCVHACKCCLWNKSCMFCVPWSLFDGRWLEGPTYEAYPLPTIARMMYVWSGMKAWNCENIDCQWTCAYPTEHKCCHSVNSYSHYHFSRSSHMVDIFLHMSTTHHDIPVIDWIRIISTHDV